MVAHRRGPRSAGVDYNQCLMARKIRQLLQDLNEAGFREISGGKGSHRKLVHPQYRGAVTLSGKLGDDAKPYQEKQVAKAIEEVQQQ